MADKEIESNNYIEGDVKGGNIAGRDNNITTNNYSLSNSYSGDLTLRKLLELHETEKQNNAEYQNFSDELNNFFKQKTENKLRNLTQKLSDGNREYLIDSAMESKERVTKKIYKHGLYKTAQEVYTYLLTNIRTTFKHRIESRIKSKKFDIFEIDDEVSDKIIKPFYQSVQGSSLYIDEDELYGLLYLLTGNCHIEWD